jgi:MFS transporter, AAHS family, 4-hydroxybenzoate transporter
MTSGLGTAPRCAQGDTVRPRLVALLCALIALCDGFDTQVIAFTAPVLSKLWNVPVSQFGPVFSAGLVGLAFGALLLGSAADRLGRKTVIILCVALFGLGSLLTARSSGMFELAGWRMVTGIGLGGVLPNLAAQTNSVARDEDKNAFVMLMFCGFPIGATIGGLIAAPIIEAFGWRSVFIVGGMVPLGLLPLLYGALPGARDRGLDSTDVKKADAVAANSVWRSLFGEGRSIPTLLVWTAFFSNLLVMYFLMNWLPSLLSLAGSTLALATLSSAVLNMGGVGGALLLSRIVNFRHALALLALVYLMGAVTMVVMARAEGNFAIVFGAALVAGAAVIGGQIAMNAVTISFYPADGRSTGLGWALGVGRIGSIVGPLLGGTLLKAGWQGTTPVLFASIPMFVAAVAVLILARLLWTRVNVASRDERTKPL